MVQKENAALRMQDGVFEVRQKPGIGPLFRSRINPSNPDLRQFRCLTRVSHMSHVRHFNRYL